ncbi:metal ABC transporter substrate-binding protein [Thermosynechococcaceae cyanobacterium BACA0444]|uniref:Metal ABC transporter substrate-binding protein n=1 Tax=Pseudocalidococcus azoricus BACA0444 TaxID=2918990 RepID=A0AAE4FNL9_9CYAN|nr:metal ABC transporter substrate-binding protein [Pseudocalidococcus azoricus]MDS3859413.1 metal ABC transporter substrate-binding protein [Pseudocalidococcus azoricus BACA0444]
MSRSKLGRVMGLGLVALLWSPWLAACQAPLPEQSPPPGTSVSSRPADSKKVILTTFTVLADMAQNVAGDKAVVESLTKPGTQIHTYEPTPSDIIRAQQADLILDNGLGLERWAQKFYGNLQGVPHITISQGVEIIPLTEGAYANQPNPHAWMSPQNALIYVENIRQALVNIDPNHARTYNQNATAYSEKIKAVDQQLRAVFEQLPPQQRTLVTCEGAFSYLTRDYGLQELYLWAVNSDQNGTPQQVRQVVDAVRAKQVPVVFCESTVSDKSQRQVAQETNSQFGGIFYVDSLTDANGPAPTYLDLLTTNLKTIQQGFQLPIQPPGAKP